METEINQQAETTNENIGQRAENRRLIKKILNFKANYLNWFCLAVLVSLGIGYLICSNQLVSHNFSFNKLQKQVSELSKDNKDLELSAMQLESYKAVSERVAQLGMVVANGAEYLEVKAGEVAMR